MNMNTIEIGEMSILMDAIRANGHMVSQPVVLAVLQAAREHDQTQRVVPVAQFGMLFAYDDAALDDLWIAAGKR
jgi:hypothetical protein